MRARSSPHLKNSHLSGELRVPLLLGALPLASQLSSTPLHMDPQIYYYPTQQQLVGARSSSKRETAQHAVSKGIGELRGTVGPSQTYKYLLQTLFCPQLTLSPLFC